MTGHVVNSEILHLVGTDIRNQANRCILTIRGQRSGLQQRREVGVRLTVIDLRPAPEEAVGCVELMVETYCELIPIDGLRWNCLETRRTNVRLRIVGEDGLSLRNNSVRADHIQDAVATDLRARAASNGRQWIIDRLQSRCAEIA